MTPLLKVSGSKAAVSKKSDDSDDSDSDEVEDEKPMLGKRKEAEKAKEAAGGDNCRVFIGGLPFRCVAFS